MSNNANLLCVNVGALAGTVIRPLIKVPSSPKYGGITVLEARFVSDGAATSVLTLAIGTAAGTGTTGTLGTLNGTFVAQVDQGFSLSGSQYVAEGEYLKLRTGAGGSLDAGSTVMISYVWGRMSA